MVYVLHYLNITRLLNIKKMYDDMQPIYKMLENKIRLRFNINAKY